MLQDNFNLSQSETLTDECVIAKKIYGRCKQQDCLKPIDCSRVHSAPCPNTELPPDIPDSIRIGSSIFTGISLTNVGTSTSPLITDLATGDIIEFDDTVASIRITDFTTTINATVSEPGQFSLPGCYDVTVQYTFNYNLSLLDSAGNPISVTLNGATSNTIPASTSYKKQISLEGGCINPNVSIVSFDSCDGGVQTDSTLPCVYVQAIANPLAVNLGVYPASTATATGTTPIIVTPCTVPSSDIAFHADVVIGLFTIIALYRVTNLTVASAGPCEVPCCQPSVINDPCVGFNQLLFPYEDFDPPYRKC